MNRFKIKLLSLFILIILLAIVVFLFLGLNKKKPASTAIPTATPAFQPEKKESPSPTLLPIEFTGEKREELPASEVEQINSAFDLRSILPIVTDDFKIEYDYKRGKFIVTLNQPFGESRLVFNKWLDENGFLKIPKEEFIYQ